MASCDAGYHCRVCGEYVDDVTESELYLRWILGELPPEQLFDADEAHIWCNSELAQYIVDPSFETVMEFRPELDKRRLDPLRVARREDVVSRAWRRLQQVPGSGWSIAEYLLDDVVPTWLPRKDGPAIPEPGADGRTSRPAES